MATYKQIFGKQVKFLSSDPANEGEGQIWFNSTSNTFKSVVNSGSWSSSAPITTARSQTAGTGIQTAALLMAGSTPPYPTVSAVVEQYNGTGWANETSLPTAVIQGAAAGTTTAALFTGGFILPPQGQSATYEYDGSTWTSGGALNTGRTQLGSGGTQTAAVVFGGSEWGGSPTAATLTEEYNGSWTTGNVMTTGRYGMMSSNVGTQIASLAIGGGPYTTNVEEYDGTNWSSQSNIPTASDAQSRFGITTAAICAGGGPQPVIGNTSFQHDGTTWSATPDMASPRAAQGGSGTTTAGVIGGAGPFTTNTEEYNVGTTVVVAGAWASAPALNTARTLGGSALPAQNSGIIFGGSPYTSATEQYNGSAWTTVPGTLNTPRGYISGFGTETAAVCAGGYTTPAPGMDVVEEYNGTAWTEETNLPAPMMNSGNCGTLTAGLLMGGSTAQPFAPNVVDTALEYDGTSWTATPGNMPRASGQGMSGGVQTAAFYAGGRTAPAYTKTTVEYNGTTFGTGGDLVFPAGPPVGFLGSIGTLTEGLAASGLTAGNFVNIYDGSAWATAPTYTTARNRGFSGGTQTAAIIAGGGPSTNTEEFTGATTAANYKTITTS